MPTDVPQKIRLAVLFGGRSGEHEVSIASATSVLQAIDRRKYEVLPVYLTPEGRWLPEVEPAHVLQPGAQPPTQSPVLLSSDPQQRGLLPLAAQSGAHTVGARPVDVVFPLLHGTYGEDGTVQGLLELADVPYIGAGVLGSAVGMDKGVMKVLFQAAGLPVVPYLVVRRLDWEQRPADVQTHILQTLTLPVFVKPANLGSSVGISKVKQVETLPAALDLACQYDRRLIIEQGMDCRELECSVLGNDEPEVSIVGEIISHREFYDYEAKYREGQSELCIPAAIDDALAAELRQLAALAFRAVDAAGLARVDFFVERQTGTPYVNEINTLPGFTTVSMYPKLWEASGLPYAQLIDRLVQLALERHHDRRRSRTTYEPTLLSTPVKDRA
ncbi:MAG: D-alanine--D-alanine ligase [Candidatus Tectomicrobia bacterium]|uniref:D-alanine--D-alanine ligase n=1 Tax=Tectimicrobiota bacterium TaxID=2528274 RepID=A0A937W2U2_UNCTE|nr:D-alanine--D-alanine ligase [Candidatus Tectomicrobia bacterium]